MSLNINTAAGHSHILTLEVLFEPLTGHEHYYSRQ